MSKPTETDRILKIKGDVDEVKGIMTNNVDQIIINMGNAEDLQDKTRDLSDQSFKFKKSSKAVRWKFWRQNMKMNLMIGGCVIIFITIIILIIVAKNKN